MIDLSERQKVWAAAAITSLAAMVVLSFVLGIGWIVLKVLHLAAPALIPVIAGLFLAMFFKPYYGWFLKRLHNPTLSFVAMSLSVMLPAGVVLWCAGSLLMEQTVAFVSAAPTIVTRASAWVQANHPGVHEGLARIGAPDSTLLFFTDPVKFSHDMFSLLGEQYGGQAVKMSFGLVKYLLGIISWLVAAIFFVYFLMKPELRGEDCVRQMPFLKDGTREFVAAQINAFIDIIVSFFQRQSVICLIEGCLYGLGFVLVGLPYGLPDRVCAWRGESCAAARHGGVPSDSAAPRVLWRWRECAASCRRILRMGRRTVCRWLRDHPADTGQAHRARVCGRDLLVHLLGGDLRVPARTSACDSAFRILSRPLARSKGTLDKRTWCDMKPGEPYAH